MFGVRAKRSRRSGPETTDVHVDRLDRAGVGNSTFYITLVIIAWTCGAALRLCARVCVCVCVCARVCCVARGGLVSLLT